MRTCGRRWGALSLLLLGCASELEDPQRFDFLLHDASSPDGEQSVPECVAETFAERCDGPDCHGPDSPTVDLVSNRVVDRLLGEEADPLGPCEGRDYIDPAGPSLLLEKVSGMPTCGDAMPSGGPALDDDERQCLEAWVGSLVESEGS